MNTAELRAAFLDYFQGKGHICVPSASLIPVNDPSLLFTNAGMVPFKDVFLGVEKRDYTRATSSQRCIRAGGKHNDLENVGFTARHHTFFEMLGNFSFGDYFKRDAIEYAWDFVTNILGLSPDKLWVTVFEDDDEAADIWLKEIGVSPERFSRCGEKDNFWAMGDTGPCGPCSEIFYDHGPEVMGGPPGTPEADGDRFVEIWNLVFMQFNRSQDGKLTPLPKPSVDTGMGLERTAAIMQGVKNNYDIDLFKSIITSTARMFKIKDLENKSLRVIADHLRSCAFLVVDGVLPGNDGRGYVLRRIMRRAIRHGRKLGINKVFFYKLVPTLVHEMGAVFTELDKQQKHIEEVFKHEEEQFDKTLEHGLKLLEQALQDVDGTEIPGNIVFKLYDTYGFPVDLTADIAREHGYTLDIAGFEREMSEQKNRARSSSAFTVKQGSLVTNATTEFTGYSTTISDAKVVELFKDDEPVDVLPDGASGVVVLDKTPFYAEAGGQVGDTGVLRYKKDTKFVVHDTQKFQNAYAHIGVNEGKAISLGDSIEAVVDAERRKKIMANHSATHLIHAALRQVVGEHVQQKGSVVDPDRLRFDFLHNAPLTDDEIVAVELLVNEKVQENSAVDVQIMSAKEAMKSGAMALFGEKYGEKVRVLTMGEDFSIELCGGTHTERTGDVGFFKIVNESGVAAGVRRIEALTGNTAVAWAQEQENQVKDLASLVKTTPHELAPKLQQMLQRLKVLEKQNAHLQAEIASGSAGKNIIDEAKDIKGVKVLSTTLPAGDPKALREAVDKFKQQLGTAVVVLAVAEQEKVSLVAGVTKNCVDKINAGELINNVAAQVGGKGGGRPDMAQAGGTKPAALNKALESVFTWVEEKL